MPLCYGGKVKLTDVLVNILMIAFEKAAKRGNNNIEISVCGVCELPFDDNTFEAISCRFGFMFISDMILTAKEMS